MTNDLDLDAVAEAVAELALVRGIKASAKITEGFGVLLAYLERSSVASRRSKRRASNIAACSKLPKNISAVILFRGMAVFFTQTKTRAHVPATDQPIGPWP